ncbi:MAG: helix-turn-helix domain-containing protein [Chthoniobacterales bacterium]|nr:helix-turn-helix domain-containing protein [Chthoniobacterales bacterium]
MPDPEDTIDLEAPSEFGIWLRQRREAKGLTPQQLAEQAGVSFPQIYNIESGRSRNPRDATRNRLAKALDEEVPKEVEEKTEQAATIGQLEFVDFDPHREEDYPEEPGIYVFYDISERPVYVGQGQNIRTRIRDHYTRFWFKRPIVQDAAFVKIEDKELREKIEKIMIQFMKSNAVLNKHHVER